MDSTTDQTMGAGTGTENLGMLESAATVCGSGPTVKGIDVSYYQGDINWPAAAGDGVEFAFVRVSDGLHTLDTKFARNWQGTKANGILRGAYQFFRPTQDALAQANLLLDTMGPLAADDLPPVIDVEAADGMSAAQIQAKVKIWIDRVTAVTGRAPIIYTGFYFWRDSVGALDATTSPLWHAQYSSVACPTIAPPWTTWAFWQYTDSGRVAGIAGGVDTNRFNGTRAQLLALGRPVAPCDTLPAEGGTLDDSGTCFHGGGPLASLRHVASVGVDGTLMWTHTTEAETESNFGEWTVDLAEAGTYRVEVSTPAPYAQSTAARYVVHAAGTDHEVAIDQTTTDGWQSLGEFDFAAGSTQFVHVGDNTGEVLSGQTQLVFDAVRLVRVGDPRVGPPDPDGGDLPLQTDTTDDDQAGCSASGSGAGLALLPVMFGLALSLRRRRRAC